MTMTSEEEVLADLRRREKDYAAAILGSSRLNELGAGDYYMLRIRNGMLLPAPEWEVLKYIFRSFPASSLIVEIGSGWGQLLTMAAAHGYAAIGIDVAVGRLEGGRYLRDLVDVDFPGTHDRVHFAQADFPSKWRSTVEGAFAQGRRPFIGFFSNLGYGATEEYCEACLAELHQFDYVIMDLVRFFANRIDAETQQAFIDKMKTFGIHYHADIFNQPGAYRFIVLTVGDAPPPKSAAVEEAAPVIDPAVPPNAVMDLHGGPITAVRSSIDIMNEPSGSPKFDRVVRIREDCTSNNSHEIRLTALERVQGGSYLLSAALRRSERTQVCIFLHRQWRDQMKIMVNATAGTGSIERVGGATFQLRSFEVTKNGEWVHVEAEVAITGEPEAVGLSIHVADDDGRYYYDGDGRSTIDVGMLRLSRIAPAP